FSPQKLHPPRASAPPPNPPPAWFSPLPLRLSGPAAHSPPRRRARLTRDNIIAGVEPSLTRIKPDYLDVVEFHQSLSCQPSISRAHYEEEAIRMANDGHYGLAAYIWTHDIGGGLRAAHG